jgi:hypothetical protein
VEVSNTAFTLAGLVAEVVSIPRTESPSFIVKNAGGSMAGKIEYEIEEWSSVGSCGIHAPKRSTVAFR